MSNRILATLMAAALFSGCGGGGGGDSSPAPEPPPVNTPADDPVAEDTAEAITFGTITRFGSIVVNGVVYDTDEAMVSINDSPGVTSDLRVGQVVAVAATAGSSDEPAAAQMIAALDAVEGPIASIDEDDDSFTVLGYTVFFDELTVFEDLDFDDLSVGNVVRVYGFQRSPRRVQATHVARTADAYTAGMRLSIKGEIESFDSVLLRFRVGTQLSDYSAAELDLGTAELADGLYVELTSSSPLDGGILTLDRIRARDRDEDRLRDSSCTSGCDFEVVGFITEFVSATDFEVDGASITTTGSTVYVNGSSASLAREASLAVSGTANNDGVIVADRITFPLASTIEIEANVDAIDSENGSLTVLGVDLLTADFTLFRDVSDADIDEFWLDDLAIGDRVEVQAYALDDTVTATRLERDDAEETVTLKAPVDSITRPSLTLLGISVTADGNTLYRDADDQSVDADTFFGLVETGNLVEAVGDFNGAGIVADTLYLRGCENSCL